MQHALVKEEMTKRAVCVGETDHLHHAFALMRRTGFRHLPVVDQGGALVGMLSDRDLLKHGLIRNDELIVGNRRVKDAMTPGAHTCQTGDRLGDIAAEMVRRRIDALPVVDAQGRVIGIITSTDLILYLRRLDGVLDLGAVMEARIDRCEPEGTGDDRL